MKETTKEPLDGMVSQWSETLKQKREAELPAELERLMGVADRLPDLDDATQEQIQEELTDFEERQSRIMEHLLAETYPVELTEEDINWLKKTWRQIPFKGEEHEYLVLGWEHIETLEEHGELPGRDIHVILLQLNKWEGKGIHKALRLNEVYTKLATPYMQWKQVMEANQRQLQRYQTRLEERLVDLADGEVDAVDQAARGRE